MGTIIEFTLICKSVFYLNLVIISTFVTLGGVTKFFKNTEEANNN